MALVRRPGVAVEQQVVDHLAEQGRIGFFAENWLWKSLFGLAFWDILFAPLPGVFQHPFQLGPLDLQQLLAVPDGAARARRAVELIDDRREMLDALGAD